MTHAERILLQQVAERLTDLLDRFAAVDQIVDHHDAAEWANELRSLLGALMQQSIPEDE